MPRTLPRMFRGSFALCRRVRTSPDERKPSRWRYPDMSRRSRGGESRQIHGLGSCYPAFEMKFEAVTPSAFCWGEREERFRRKFETGEWHIRSLFQGLELPEEIHHLVDFGCPVRNMPTRGHLRACAISSSGRFGSMRVSSNRSPILCRCDVHPTSNIARGSRAEPVPVSGESHLAPRRGTHS